MVTGPEHDRGRSAALVAVRLTFGDDAFVAELTREDIIAGWSRLGELADAAGSSVELLVIGGAVMAVHFRSRDTTADVDGAFEPAAETRKWAAIVAAEKGWPEDWLNDGAKGYLNQDSKGPVIHVSRGITVRTVAIPHLLALKLMAWRDDVDFNDAQRLVEELRKDPEVDISDKDKLFALVEPYFLEARKLEATYAVGELWQLVLDVPN